MADIIARRYRMNADKTLLDVYRLDADFVDTMPDAEFMVQHREQVLNVLGQPEKFARLVELFVNLTIEFTYASNQFIQLNEREKAELRRIYTGYLREMEAMLRDSDTEDGISAGLQAVVADHFRDLRANITRFFDPETGADARANVILQKVVCAEYTPEMQLEVLGARMADLAQPVLDLGCGKSGGLVEYLNQNGIQAVGVDRVVDTSPHLIQADWLKYRLEPEAWGTVLSHMAFSNHFVFQHLYRSGSVEPYARQYMAILRSLRVGGSFYYAPGLPFIEAYLPEETYGVTRRWIREKERLYACRVRRHR